MKSKKNLLVGGMLLTIMGSGLQPVFNRAFAQTTQPKTPLENQLSPQPKTNSQIQLITPGAQPRQKLRFVPQVGQKETADMQMDMDMSMSVNGNEAPSFKIPGTSVKLNTVVNKVEQNGDIYYDFSYDNVDITGESNLPASALEDMRREIKKMQGLKGNVIVDNKGRTKKANFTIPKNFNPALKQTMEQLKNSIEQLSAQVPTEAVGKGAKWQHTSRISFNGITLEQTINYELVDIQDDIATMNINLIQKAPGAQKIVLPQVPKGMTMTMESYNASGTGQSKVSLNQIMPLSTSLKMNANTQMRTNVPNSSETMLMNQQISTQLNIQSK
ncbi:MAG: hypothetical protein KI793_02065 [Rivularia sp. (in: Bacteria)]|nr:hypothetical protein [Rivularia sp. MS3]